MPSQLSSKAPRAARRGFAVMAALMLSALPIAAAAAHAAPTEELSWSIKPGGTDGRTNFSYDLEAGSKKKDTFEVTNLGSTDISLAIYAADGVTSGGGSLDLLPADEPSTVIGAWVKVDQPAIELSPGETAKVDFTLKVPRDTEPGDYVGGLISSYVDNSSGSTVVVDRRLATRMNVRVGGEGTVALQAQDVKASTTTAWNPFAPSATTVEFTMKNTGTVRARGSYTVSVQGPFGLGKKSRTFTAEELIPGGSATVVQQLEGIWPLFTLDTEVSVAPEGIDSSPGQPNAVSLEGWAVPWGQLALLLLLVAAAVVIGLRRGRYYEDVDDDEIAEVTVPPQSSPTGRRAATRRESVDDH